MPERSSRVYSSWATRCVTVERTALQVLLFGYAECLVDVGNGLDKFVVECAIGLLVNDGYVDVADSLVMAVQLDRAGRGVELEASKSVFEFCLTIGEIAVY